jgi:hypothetical protein
MSEYRIIKRGSDSIWFNIMGKIHSFVYSELPAQESEAFPLTVQQRPIVAVFLNNGPHRAHCEAVVDSGADRCVFPFSLVSSLGLDLKIAKRGPETFGHGSADAEVMLFWTVTMNFSGKFSLETLIGFS